MNDACGSAFPGDSEVLCYFFFQIKESASQTRDVLKQHFNDLKGTLAKLLDERLVTLLQEVDTIEQETIKPLDDCQKLIEHGVNTAEDLVQEGGSPGSLLNVAHSGRCCAGFPGHQQAFCCLWVLRLFLHLWKVCDNRITGVQ